MDTLARLEGIKVIEQLIARADSSKWLIGTIGDHSCTDYGTIIVATVLAAGRRDIAQIIAERCLSTVLRRSP